MTITTHGIVHGKTIELADDLGLPDGERVEITVQPAPSPEKKEKVWGEGLRRCAGALANEWTEEDDRILEQIYQERKLDTRRELPKPVLR